MIRKQPWYLLVKDVGHSAVIPNRSFFTTIETRPSILSDAAQIEKDRREGCIPCCIVGMAGATSTGVIDPLPELAAIARENDCWFHVDAAYGGGLAFSDRHRDKLHGIELAHSITFDPHKWMFVPFACGATLVREGGKVLRDSFDISPEYLGVGYVIGPRIAAVMAAGGVLSYLMAERGERVVVRWEIQ